MTKSEKKKLAQKLIMHQISIIGYGAEYEAFEKQIGDTEEAQEILFEQMERIANLFNTKAYYS